MTPSIYLYVPYYPPHKNILHNSKTAVQYYYYSKRASSSNAGFSLADCCDTLKGESPYDVPEAVQQCEAVLLLVWLSPFSGTDPAEK